MTTAFQHRCRRAQEAMAAQNLDGLFATISSDLRYLTGYTGHLTTRLNVFWLPREGTPTLVMPGFETPRLQHFQVFYDVRGWEETEDPVAIVKGLVGPGRKTIAVSDQFPSLFLLPLGAALADARFVSAGPILTPLRMIKDADEIATLREIGRRMDKVFEETVRLKFSGRAEMQVGYDIFDIVRAHGLNPVRAGGVASGPNSASPHHSSTDRVIQRGDAIWLELGQGGTLNGYLADKTRSVHVGEPTAEYRRVYEVVKAAQEAAFRAIRPGVPCQEIDRTGRRAIASAGYGQYFIHRLGHGLGLDVHEPPYIVGGNTLPLQPGMVFSDEPGIYLPGQFGIRIEDIVTVTATGGERFYASTHDLLVVE
ncbi:MAG: aminopeptidase P family protein [Armatimonadetes bacterium]|nr:aminopeptidase P family protein [Armatimonadota bacterium]